MANRAAHEGQLRADEVRILRSEIDQLKTLNQELKLKAQVELEALHEQLRVRKEKQYQLLEKLQAQDRVKRLAEDQVSSMEEKLRQLHAKSVELDTHLQVETRNRRMKEESNRNLTADLNNLMEEVKEVRNRSNLADSERLRIEAEARDSGDQLREMAEKVFQLLERLKLAELGKTKAMEALRKKEQTGRLFNALGMDVVETPELALAFWRRALHAAPKESELASEVMGNLCVCLNQLGRHAEALDGIQAAAT